MIPMTGMKTTDRWVVTVVTANGLHTKVRYSSHQEDEAKAACIKAALVPGVVRTSVDLIPDYKGNQITRVWV
jgi:oligoribonuclease (3'-5' exoribonuclease)